jgi:hypothetical protein
MNGNSGITPTVELATTNGNNGFGYPYPVMPFYGANGNDGFFGDSGIWAIILLALLFGNGGWGGFGGFGGGFGGMYEFPWLLNGQQEIMTNTNNGFDTLHLSNQLEGVRDGVSALSNQLCNCCADMNQTVSNGFFNAETSANTRQIANMQQSFNNQISTLQGFNNIGTQLCDASADNRLGIANLTATVLSENCADRQALSEGIRDIIASQTAGIQSIKDQLCQDKIDAKNDEIAQLRQEILYARGQASQVQQTNDIVNSTYSRFRDCPVGTVPVFGNQPIFTCSSNLGNGCGCGYNTTSQFI